MCISRDLSASGDRILGSGFRPSDRYAVGSQDGGAENRGDAHAGGQDRAQDKLLQYVPVGLRLSRYSGSGDLQSGRSRGGSAADKPS